MKNIDFDTYYSKHCARYYGWLPASIEYQKRIKKKPLKYFTLCGINAIDVFMLEMEGVLLRDKNKKLLNVIICEKEQRDAIEILKIVRPPIDEALIIGSIEKILTFEDNKHTINRSPDEDDRSPQIRNMLRIKGKAQRLKSYFPFDIINFDAYGNILNPDNEANKLLFKAFEKIFELQENIDTFLLFITTPITDIHNNYKLQFHNDFNLNVSRYSEIKTALQSSLNTIVYNEIEENKKIAISFAKSLVMRASRNMGWDSEHKGIYIYENIDKRKMLNSIIKFSKAHTETSESKYVDDVIRVIEQMPEYFSYDESLKNQEVKNHLEQIIEYRENVRNVFFEES